MWHFLAYCARYGNQPLPVLLSMRYGELVQFAKALEKLIASENNSTP